MTNRAKVAVVALAAVVVSGCQPPQVNTTRLGSQDLVVMTDEMVTSLLREPAVGARGPEASTWVITMDRAVNKTNDVMPRNELWAFMARLRAQLNRSPAMAERGMAFITPAEWAAQLDLEADRRAADYQRAAPTHALMATFYSLTTAERRLRSDAYLCEFRLIDLATEHIVWTDKYEVKYAVARNRFD